MDRRLEMKREITREAALYLDETIPDWFYKINTDTLRLYSGEKCICGQLGFVWLDPKFRSSDLFQRFLSAFVGTHENFWIEEIESRKMKVPDFIPEELPEPEPAFAS